MRRQGYKMPPKTPNSLRGDPWDVKGEQIKSHKAELSAKKGKKRAVSCLVRRNNEQLMVIISKTISSLTTLIKSKQS